MLGLAHLKLLMQVIHQLVCNVMILSFWHQLPRCAAEVSQPNAADLGGQGEFPAVVLARPLF
jgi:hypothetical protein